MSSGNCRRCGGANRFHRCKLGSICHPESLGCSGKSRLLLRPRHPREVGIKCGVSLSSEFVGLFVIVLIAQYPALAPDQTINVLVNFAMGIGVGVLTFSARENQFPEQSARRAGNIEW